MIYLKHCLDKKRILKVKDVTYEQSPTKPRASQRRKVSRPDLGCSKIQIIPETPPAPPLEIRNQRREEVKKQKGLLSMFGKENGGFRFSKFAYHMPKRDSLDV